MKRILFIALMACIIGQSHIDQAMHDTNQEVALLKKQHIDSYKLEIKDRFEKGKIVQQCAQDMKEACRMAHELNCSECFDAMIAYRDAVKAYNETVKSSQEVSF